MTADPALSSPTDQPSTSLARTAMEEMFAAWGAGATPEELAERFHEDVDCFIPGDTETVPWIGRKVGRAGIAEHFAQLAEGVTTEAWEVDTIMTHGNRAVMLGSFRPRVIATDRVIESEYAVDVAVDEAGLITRYHMLEDSWAVSEAARP
ncbi:hypothetical protein GCM10010413_30090 [Promicromonospora sukumoe]|uniref:SnoaL-like domain-containing protein n=1 Tax=Promicromonospora sukumoe TaxID=88382 RepID=A0A7W3J7T9_9MICO|nr:nuclear transport factor 2 family protein [Promicromonospora sukumoe]MBA8807759.1 hypothetical protein [Promicromonospora sukumoe]